MDGPPPQEEDFSALSVADRLAHKNWKARVSAYETLVKTFQTTASDTDPAFKPYINNADLLKRIVADSNAVAQEKGVECLVAFVKYAGETAAKTREAVLPVLVEKCFGSSRAGTRAQAVELTLQYVEVENGGAGSVVRGIFRSYAIDLMFSTGRYNGRIECKAAQDSRRMHCYPERNISVSGWVLTTLQTNPSCRFKCVTLGSTPMLHHFKSLSLIPP